MSHLQLAMLGGGNMGRALIGGLLRHGTRPEQIAVGESIAAARAALAADLGITATADNAAAIGDAPVVVLAVKPQDAAAVLAPLRLLLEERRPLLLSVAAGIRVATLQRCCGAGVPVVRAMPNRPALVGAGATGLYAGPEVAAAQRATAARIMQSVGEVVWVDSEDALDVVTALSGSGPAYFFLLAELLARAAEREGLAADAARRLAVATLHGAGLMAQFESRGGDADLARLRAEVTSRGGTTEAALRAFETGGLEPLVRQAVAAAARRSRELAAMLGNP